uniref:Uncharacterized protein n=1 Tax=Arundo donax TaxID=35708 RepID=A0A0A9TRR0_ARUDO
MNRAGIGMSIFSPSSHVNI